MQDNFRFNIHSGCSNPHVPRSKPDTSTNKQSGVLDVHWYPDEHKLVFDSSKGKNLVVELSDLAPTESKTKKNIFAWNNQATGDTDPNNDYRLLIPKNTPFDEALQILAHEFEHNFVWKIYN